MRDSARRALLIGFGGMLAIFLVAGFDSIRVLRQMRVENAVLHQASVDRSHRLASIRSYVLLSQNYMGEYFAEANEERAREQEAQLEQTWSRMLTDLAEYRATSPDETELIAQLRSLLDQDGRELTRVLDQRQRDEQAPMRTAMLEITTRVEAVDARQLAEAEAGIQNEFENMGRHLTTVLEIAIGSAVILALGCFLYILKIEEQNRRRYQEIEEARTALEQLSARLVSAQEEERRSISRELHDEIGQTLTAVIVDTANLADRIPASDTVSRQYLENIRSHADRSVDGIRNLALLLRPSMLDDLGLIPALEWQAREMSRRSGINVKVNDENVPESLPDDVRTGIYRIVQEALNNVARHSGAHNAMVSVRRDNGSLTLTIEDDGKGFDPSRTKGLGLLGMDERVRQLGGQLEIDSGAGKGTRLSVSLPLK